MINARYERSTVLAHLLLGVALCESTWRETPVWESARSTAPECRSQKGKTMRLLRSHWFALLSTFILGVSLYDTFLIVQFKDLIAQTEQNPVGRWLIHIANGDVGVFVRVKLAGTIIVMATLATLYKRRSKKTLPVTTSIAGYQSGLLAYLTFA